MLHQLSRVLPSLLGLAFQTHLCWAYMRLLSCSARYTILIYGFYRFLVGDRGQHSDFER